MQPLRRLGPYFARYHGRLFAGIFAVFAAAVVGLAAPLLIGGAVDSLRQAADPRTLLRYGLLLVAVTLVQGLFSFAQRRLLVGMSRDIEFDLRDDYFSHLQTLPLSFYRESYTGDLMARATNDLQAVRMICGPAIMYSSNTVFTAAGALFFMARIHERRGRHAEANECYRSIVREGRFLSSQYHCLTCQEKYDDW